MYPTNAASYSNHTNPGISVALPGPFIYTDPAAASEYNAATISSIAFGIFMALLTLYMIWQNGVQCISTHHSLLIFQLLIPRFDRSAETTPASHHE
jgi:hypothetical protein